MVSRTNDSLSPEQIIGLIRYITGMTVPQFAKHIGVHKTNVYLAIRGKQIKTPVRDIIADAVGMKKEELWPEAAMVGEK
ncbi:MAG: hypothetical protein KQH59_18370 [Desulfobulbaceae bacterium]|nr:hypothetical protein [Desulfobulbaceae bacterium]